MMGVAATGPSLMFGMTAAGALSETISGGVGAASITESADSVGGVSVVDAMGNAGVVAVSVTVAGGSAGAAAIGAGGCAGGIPAMGATGNEEAAATGISMNGTQMTPGCGVGIITLGMA